ncbi:hypothetical protein PROFUN_05607 [Planoprotostelium fungivorum]|uniref:Asl1-like glycosyl hydrolase catalytic domain-containing protein n=1 Tax=Planoprotostelium fungivorum TaxID=1890364 RepID=A0A2P6N084_9EUKA|nr:hypothetical protein PROFUN_05607 [Planoprotostelium fungivorum]
MYGGNNNSRIQLYDELDDQPEAESSTITDLECDPLIASVLAVSVLTQSPSEHRTFVTAKINLTVETSVSVSFSREHNSLPQDILETDMGKTIRFLIFSALVVGLACGAFHKRQDSVDYPGGDLDGMPISVSNSSECQKKCLSRSDCTGWSVDTCGGSSCWLKGPQFGVATPSSCRLSALNPNYVGAWDAHTERGGYDLPNMPVTMNSGAPLVECQALCYSRGDCASWAVRLCNNETSCYLKGAVPNAVPSDCIHSGVNRITFNGGWNMAVDRGMGDAPQGPIKFTGNATVMDCWGACSIDPKCVSYAYDTCGGNQCWLKYSAPLDPVDNQCRATGMSHTYHGDWDQQTDRGGYDLPNMPINMPAGSAPINCQAKCGATAECAAWAFSGEFFVPFAKLLTVKSDCTNQCWLKNSQPATGPNNCITSGINRNWKAPNGLKPNGKKAGLAGGTAFNFFQDHIGWWYDWSPVPSGHPGKPIAVPMLWGDGTHGNTDRQRYQQFMGMKGSTPTYFLGFNEPDCPGSASSAMAVQRGADLWNQYIAQFADRGTLLGSPSMCMQFAERWLQEFRPKIGRMWDFTAIHIYKNSMDGVRKDIDHYWNTFGKPIWVTEFGCVDDSHWRPSTDQGEINRFINDIVDLFEHDDRVMAYSYSDVGDLGNQWPLTRNGQLTESGHTYLNAVSRYN